MNPRLTLERAIPKKRWKIGLEIFWRRPPTTEKLAQFLVKDTEGIA